MIDIQRRNSGFGALHQHLYVSGNHNFFPPQGRWVMPGTISQTFFHFSQHSFCNTLYKTEKMASPHKEEFTACCRNEA